MDDLIRRCRAQAAVAFDQASSAEALVDALDTLIEKGVVLEGDVELGLADVALVRAGVRLYLSAVRCKPELDRWRTASRRSAGHHAAAADEVPPPVTSSREPPPSLRAGSREEAGVESARTLGRVFDEPPATRRRDPARGLAHLVILLVDVLRRLLERQAFRRVEEGNLSEDEVEKLGLTFAALEERMSELAEILDLPGEVRTRSTGARARPP